MVAKTLGLDRVAGSIHGAGSDSLLMLQTFMKLNGMYFNGHSLSDFECVVHGLTNDLTDGGEDDQEVQFQLGDSDSK